MTRGVAGPYRDPDELLTPCPSEDSQLRILEGESASVVKLEGTWQGAPKDVTTGGIAPSTQGLLVRASGNVTRTFVDDSPYGYKLYFNDGSGEVQLLVHVSAGFDPAMLRAISQGQHLQVTGFSSQYETTSLSWRPGSPRTWWCSRH